MTLMLIMDHTWVQPVELKSFWADWQKIAWCVERSARRPAHRIKELLLVCGQLSLLYIIIGIYLQLRLIGVHTTSTDFQAKVTLPYCTMRKSLARAKEIAG
jgi:hypothetical protein